MPVQAPLIDRALDRTQAMARMALFLDRPLIGLGAGARAYYPDAADMVRRYRQRVQIEERFRQFKLGWSLAQFPSPHRALKVLKPISSICSNLNNMVSM